MILGLVYYNIYIYIILWLLGLIKVNVYKNNLFFFFNIKEWGRMKIEFLVWKI